ncbi:hypothetical protein ABEX47_16300 [Paenibacillus ehimensis]|uniref:hypothetical protein n=1 Tax=Paenibacillus ehimensis TaxID=79264 RepID=UPI000472D8F3|nr:hypothetical protein [Paenibacillus ehimensis]MEC0211786.1 hypothetical protein [Paenibacillus ehimensis]
MDMLYRRAVLQDSPEIARLSGQLGYPAKAEQIEERLASILNAADHVVIVAEAQSELVGFTSTQDNTKTQQVFRKEL